MGGFIKIALALTLSLNLTDDSDKLTEELMFGSQNNIESSSEDLYEGYALVLKNNTPMFNKITLEDEICTLDRGTLVFYEDRGEVMYVYNDELSGFVKRENVTTENIYEKAETMGLQKVIKPIYEVNVNSLPAYQGVYLCEKTPQDILTYVGEDENFYEVQLEDVTGFIEKRYARKTFIFTTIVVEEDNEESRNSNLANVQLTKQQALEIINNSSDSPNSIGTRVATKALDYIGNKYVWGGNSLEQGVDCSGFVKQLYLSFGLELPRTSRYQALYGYQINKEQLEPGDLVFYDKNGVVNHVAIYLGKGYIIHASNRQSYPRGGIKISKMEYRIPCKYVRVED